MELETALTFVGQRRQGVLVTIRRDARPQLSNILYAAADALIRISVTADRAKTKNLQRDPRATLYVGGDSHWSYVVCDGHVDLSAVAKGPADETVEELVSMYRQLSGEHPDWNDYRRAMVEERRLVIRFHPERAYGIIN